MIQYQKDIADHDRRYAIDATKIETELGWKAEKVNCEGREATLVCENFDTGIVENVHCCFNL